MAQANIHTIKKTKIALKKSLGQNFLTDQNIVNKIIKTAQLDKNTTVIEIGPGIGALTEVMVEQAKNVVAIEIDQRLIPVLEQNIPPKNFNLLNEDFLKITNEKLNPFLTGQKIKVVANLPYYITTAIITKILLEMPFVDEIYIMVQKEVAERIAAIPCTKKYNSLSVFCQTISDVTYEFTVKRTVFNPPPKVDSAIISLKRKNFNVNLAAFEQFVQNCFRQKRKTLINNLSAAYQLDKIVLGDFLKNHNYPLTVRSEEIGIEQFIALFESFSQFFKSTLPREK